LPDHYDQKNAWPLIFIDCPTSHDSKTGFGIHWEVGRLFAIVSPFLTPQPPKNLVLLKEYQSPKQLIFAVQFLAAETSCFGMLVQKASY
jgi:hypothetical protein